MTRQKKLNLHEQINENLRSKLAIGQSKHEDKKKNATSEKIYSWSTYHSYKKHSFEFVTWARNNEKITQQLGHKARTLEELRPFVKEWLEGEISRDMSASTVHLKASAMAKLYACSTPDFGVELPERKRSDIKRSRGEAKRDAHFSEKKNADLVMFCKCCGLRRSELVQIRGEDIRIDENGAYLHITRGTKGGRPRDSRIYGTPEEIEKIKEMCIKAGSKKMFPSVSEAADIHSYRSVYACKVYKTAERNFDEYKNERMIIYKNRIVEIYTAKDRSPDRSKKEYYNAAGLKDRHGNIAMLPGYKDVSSVYVCRLDQKSVYYDRQAMFEASRELGHNRESVIAGHYLYNLDNI